MFAFEDRTRALLSGVEALGSVSAAARTIGMDASNAHRHLQTAEARLGRALVRRARGGAAGGSAELTRAGRRLVAGADGAPGVLAEVGAYDAREGTTRVEAAGRVLHAAGRHAPGWATLVVRGEDVALSRARPDAAASARNALDARVEALAPSGEGVFRARLAAGRLRLDATLTRGAVRALRLRVGSRVVASVKASALRLDSLV